MDSSIGYAYTVSRFGRALKLKDTAQLFKIGTIALLFLVALSQSQAPQPSAANQESALIDDLVYANRILYDQGMLDGFGHVSVRDGKNPGEILTAQARA